MRLLLIVLYFLSRLVLASDAYILDVLTQTRHSLDHLSNFQADVFVKRTEPEKITTVNFVFKVSGISNKLAVLDKEVKQYHLLNKRGYFLIYNHDVLDQDRDYPFYSPLDSLAEMNLVDVTKNFTLQLAQETDDSILIHMLPIISEGQSIDAFMAQPINRLSLTILKPHYLLSKVETYENYELTPASEISFSYDETKNPQLKKQVFVNKLIPNTVPYVSYIRSTTRYKDGQETQTYLIETWYRDFDLNVDFLEDVFDEEAY